MGKMRPKIPIADIWKRLTELGSRLVDDGTTNVVACSFRIKHSTQYKVKQLKIRDRDFCVKLERTMGVDDEWILSVERDDTREEWIFKTMITLGFLTFADTHFEFLPGETIDTHSLLFPGGAMQQYELALRFEECNFIHIECSLWFPLGEVLLPEKDAVLVCEEKEFPINRNYVSHFSKYLTDLFTKENNSKKFNIEMLKSDELENFLTIIKGLYLHDRPVMSALVASRALGGHQFMLYNVESVEIRRSHISSSYYAECDFAFGNVEKAQKHDLKVASYEALNCLALINFDKHKESFDKLNEETKKLCEERRVELEERKNDMEREEKEMEEWKKNA